MNVILNVFSCSSQAPCVKWASQYFSGNTVSIVVPNPFQQNAIRWAKTGDLFKAALTELRPDLKHEQIDQRILVTFSVGWTFAHELLFFKEELNKLDAYILLDGCHTQDLERWSDFVCRAMKGDAIMLAAHSSIIPPFISSTKSNTTMMELALHKCSPCGPIYVPDYISSKLLQKPITINLSSVSKSGQHLPAISKTWKEDPLLDITIHGKFAKLHYSGNDRPDHVYIAWYTAEKLWKWMGNLLMDDTSPEIPKLKKPYPDIPQDNNDPLPITEIIKDSPKEAPTNEVPTGEIKDIVRPNQNPIIAFFVWLFSLITSIFKK